MNLVPVTVNYNRGSFLKERRKYARCCFADAAAPAPAEIPHEITFHGHTRVDDFYWLRNIEDPAVTDYLLAENTYTDSIMARSRELMDTILEELIERIPEDESSVPYYRNGWWYWYEYPPGADYAVNMRRTHPDGEPLVLLDENSYGDLYGYFDVGMISVSPDNRTLAWAYDTTGGHWYTLVFQDIHTGDTLDVINNASGDLAWAADSRMVFYGLNDKTGRTERIMRRTIACDDEITLSPRRTPPSGPGWRTPPTASGCCWAPPAHLNPSTAYCPRPPHGIPWSWCIPVPRA